MTVLCHHEKPFERKPRALLFDLDNTLYPYVPAHEAGLEAMGAKAKSTLGIDKELFLSAFQKARLAIKTELKGTAASHSRLLCAQRALEALDLRTQVYVVLDLEQTYWRTFLASSELFAGAQAFVRLARQSGFLTCLVTDLTAQIQFRKLIYLGLKDDFDFVVTSEEAGADKPSPEPFALALAKLKINPEEAVMIGEDAETDILGAKRAGIATLQKRHTGVVVHNDRRKADLVFDTYPELGAFLRQRGWLVGTKTGRKGTS